MRNWKRKHCLLFMGWTNGLVERFNKSLKQAIKTGMKGGDPIRKVIANYLLMYRATPHSVTKTSPSELFMGRKIKTRLDLLRPELRSQVGIRQEKQSNKRGHGRTVLSFVEGQKVWIRDYQQGKAQWIAGWIKEILGTRSYVVETEDGCVMRRHSDQLCPRETIPSTHGDGSDVHRSEWWEVESPSAPDELRPADPATPRSSTVRRYPSTDRRPTVHPGFVSH